MLHVWGEKCLKFYWMTWFLICLLQFSMYTFIYTYTTIYSFEILDPQGVPDLAMAQSPSSPRSALGYLKHRKQFKVYSQALALSSNLRWKHDSAIMYLFQLTRGHNLILKKMFSLLLCWNKSSIVYRFSFGLKA